MNAIPMKPLAILTISLILLAGTTSEAPAQALPHAVPYELGAGEFAPGDGIKIGALTGTSAAIELGGTYCVTGTYVLNSRAEADLSFFATTTNRVSTPVEPAQTVHVHQGAGSFRLVKKMTEPGYLHLTFYSPATGQGFGGVYFGQGGWVLRDKPFSYAQAAAPSPETAAPNTPALSGPNQVMFDYLGDPVAPPPDMDAAYSKAGLTRALQTAARKAGITLVTLEIDDSEFPFLVGVVFARPDDRRKLEEQIRTLEPYHFSGGVDGDAVCAMNLVPDRAFPGESSTRIFHRLMLREAVLYEKIARLRPASRPGGHSASAP
jgi:hypothetical protein